MFQMRIPTSKEWDKLVEVTGGNNDKMHWKEMYSHIIDTENEYGLWAGNSACRGFRSAHSWNGSKASYRCISRGFRPAIADLPLDILPSEGTVRVIGTLYMNEVPVKIPKDPLWYGDIVDYIPGAKLEMREALPDPDYQVTGIYLGNGVFVADRALLKNISYEDIEQALTPATK